MASQINSSNIDENFPVAGQDNDSQGFRDNFSTIKTSLGFAKAEIETLQENTAKLNADNDFGTKEISNAKFRNNAEVYFNETTPGPEHLLLFEDGNYQVLQVSTTLRVNLSSFRPPNGSQVVYKTRILFTGSGNVEWLAGSGIFRVNSTWPKRINPTNPFTVTSNQPVLVDIWTTDGVTYYGYYHGNFVAIDDDGI